MCRCDTYPSGAERKAAKSWFSLGHEPKPLIFFLRKNYKAYSERKMRHEGVGAIPTHLVR
jgi:hypothetical protein